MGRDQESGSTQHGSSGDRILGFPLAGFSLLQSLLLTAATGFFVFFLSTTLAIFALLAWNLSGHHPVDYADSYRYVGLPAGTAALAFAFVYFIVLWTRAKLRKG